MSIKPEREVLIVSHCACCGREHTAAGWARLRYRGPQAVLDVPWAPATTFEIRDCLCASSLAIDLHPDRRPAGRLARATSPFMRAGWRRALKRARAAMAAIDAVCGQQAA